MYANTIEIYHDTLRFISFNFGYIAMTNHFVLTVSKVWKLLESELKTNFIIHSRKFVCPSPGFRNRLFFGRSSILRSTYANPAIHRSAFNLYSNAPKFSGMELFQTEYYKFRVKLIMKWIWKKNRGCNKSVSNVG